MLVLTRKPGESIVIPGCQVTVTVVSIRGNRVQLGIDAPPEVAVHRVELWTKLNDPPPATAYPDYSAIGNRSRRTPMTAASDA